MIEPIYLDHHSTTPLDPRVLEKMLPYFLECYGNPSSIDHLYGYKAKKAVDEARHTIGKHLGCRKDSEIIFTSGATEANNLALIGAFRRYCDKGRHVIASAIEHPAVLDTLKYLEGEGAEVTLLPVDSNGIVDVDVLREAIQDDTILISVMFANHEIGSIQPIREIGKLAKSKGILFHVDAAQAVGHEVIHVYDMNIDLMSFSAHKFYGPKGVGGLFVRSFSPMVRFDSITYGGGQERGLRSGTINVPGIVGMCEALNFMAQGRQDESERMKGLSAYISTALREVFPQIKINGHQERKLAHNLSLTIPGVEAKALIHILREKLSFSAGSACSTTKVQASHVLRAMGLTDEETFQTIRIGLGRSNDSHQPIAEQLIDGIVKIIDHR